MKKIVLIASVIIAILAMILWVYVTFFQNQPEPAPEATPTAFIPAITELPAISAPNISSVSQVPFFGAALGPTDRIRFYDHASQSFMESDSLGQNPVRLLSLDVKNVIGLTWSPDKTKVVVTSDEQGIKKYRFIDLTSGKSADYNTHVRSVVFSPDGNKIAYNFIWPEKNLNKIEIADPSGDNWKEISKIRMQDLRLTWPQTGTLGLHSLSSSSSYSPLLAYNLSDGSLTKIIPDSYGLEILWSPSGDKVLYSSADENGKGLSLRVTDISGSSVRNLQIPTFASKCYWSKDNRTIYCAVDENPPQNAKLPDDYWQGNIVFNDRVLKINIDTGEATVVFNPADNRPDVQNLFTDSNEKFLFFTNKKDGLFYAARL